METESLYAGIGNIDDKLRMKRKVLIVTINDYILYQPTILNLYDLLEKDFDVTIISFEPKYISKEKDTLRKIIYLKVNPLLTELVNKIDFVANKVFSFLNKIWPGEKYQYLYYNKVLPSVLKKRLGSLSANMVIAVDIPALYVAQQIFGKVHLLSLEIDLQDPFYKKINIHNILSVFIQNSIRFNHLFPGIEMPVFFVQNAPVFNTLTQVEMGKKGFVWAGTLLERFAVLDCINFFKHFPQYRLVLKGGAEKNTLKKITDQFGELVENGTVTINRNYLPADEFIRFLAGFRIGFCFYSWELIRSSFNYSTAPSGKLFMYMAAGVPVIASNIPGFKFVEEYGAGILIDDYKPETIKSAVDRIEKDFEKYAQACFMVADHYSFEKNAAPYIQFLKKGGEA